MIFHCFVLLLSVSLFEKGTAGQKVRWEDDFTTNSSELKLNNEEVIGEARSIKSDSDSNNVKNSKTRSSNNEIVSKRYYPQPQQPPYLQQAPYPQPPGFQVQYNSQFSTPQLNGVGGGNNWEWSSTVTTQQSRKPSLVQFPGEKRPEVPVQSSSYNSFSSSSRRGTSGSIRIDETCHCGVIPLERDSKKLQRVVGGTISEDNSWPWMVAITYMGQSKPFWFCGGSLISDKFVLTAAHCLRTIRNFGLSNVKLIMGTNNLLESKHATYFSIRAVRPHPMYKSGTEEYDIALIEIKEKVNFTSRVSPICLKQEGEPFTNRTAIVAGWGSLQNGEGPPADLREVDLKIVSNDFCQKEYYYNYRTTITSSMICAWLPGKDSCQGDSGGPLFLKTTSSPFAYTQIGTVSFGPPACGTTTVPGVYSRIASSIKWIKSIARNGKFCKGSF